MTTARRIRELAWRARWFLLPFPVIGLLTLLVLAATRFLPWLQPNGYTAF